MIGNNRHRITIRGAGVKFFWGDSFYTGNNEFKGVTYALYSPQFLKINF